MTVTGQANLVTLLSDAVAEGDETIILTLTSTSAGTLGTPSSHTVTVRDPALAATTKTVTSSANPSVFGQSVTFTATVANSTVRGPTPSGTATLFVDGAPPGSPVTLVNGQATFTTATLPVGGTGHTVEAFYAPTENFQGSTGRLTPNQTVNRAATTTTVTGPTTSTAGHPVTFTAAVAAVAPGAGVPIETFTFGIGDGTTEPGNSVTLSYAVPGVYTVTATYRGDANFNTSTSDGFTITVAAGSTAPVGFAVGAGEGALFPLVKVFDTSDTETVAFEPFERSFKGGVRVATGDFNGDGTADVAAGTGPGSTSRVVVRDGKTGAIILDYAPFEPAFVGGVYVAAGDIDGDGKAELVITPDESGGPRVQMLKGGTFSGATAAKFGNDFLGIDDMYSRGGARAAIGDINGDGIGDLVVAAGIGAARVPPCSTAGASTARRRSCSATFSCSSRRCRTGRSWPSGT